MNELISIIIPIYNTEKYLKKCIDSVILQSYYNIEIILVNDGSTDNSLNICKEYKKKDKRIKLIDKKNGGLSDARNVGIKNSKGKYIGFVDSDDFIERDMYKILYEGLKKYEADISICKMTKKENIKNNTVQKKCVFDRNEAIRRLLFGEEIDNYACNKLIKKELFNDVTFPIGRKFEDLATMHLLIEKSNLVVYNNYIGYHYIQREGSITKSYSKTYLDDYIWATNEFIKNILNNHKELKKETDSTYAKGIVNIFSACTKAHLKEYYNEDKMNYIYMEYCKICKRLGLFKALKKINFKHKLFGILLYLNKNIAYIIGSKM